MGRENWSHRHCRCSFLCSYNCSYSFPSCQYNGKSCPRPIMEHIFLSLCFKESCTTEPSTRSTLPFVVLCVCVPACACVHMNNHFLMCTFAMPLQCMYAPNSSQTGCSLLSYFAPLKGCNRKDNMVMSTSCSHLGRLE